MATFLLAWNPKKWIWKAQELANQIQLVTAQGYAVGYWSCGRRKHLPVRSRFFLVRLGQEPKGIVASGRTTSEPSYRPHWDLNLRREGKKNLSVNVRFDFLDKAPLVRWDELQAPPFSSTNWGIQAGGVALAPSVAHALEELWHRRTRGDGPMIPEELNSNLTIEEGTSKQVLVNAYERDPRARAACIAYYGLRCSVCDLLMEDRYGEIAGGFIHVHHITPLSKLGRSYRVDPGRILRPCALTVTLLFILAIHLYPLQRRENCFEKGRWRGRRYNSPRSIREYSPLQNKWDCAFNGPIAPPPLSS